MTDREKVINDLQDAVNDDWMWRHADYYAKAMKNALAMLKDSDRIKVTRCKDCRYFEPSNAEEGDNSGCCMNDYAPCQNQTVDAWWFCGSAERVSE